MGVNYGMNKVRYTGIVPVNSRIRGRYKLLEIKDVDAKTTLLTWGVTGEREGEAKPVLIAENLSRRVEA
jgi:acyl dehydratase